MVVRGFFFFLWVGVVVKCLIAARRLLASPWRKYPVASTSHESLPLSLIRASDPVMKPSLAQGVRVKKLLADIVDVPVMLPRQEPPANQIPQFTRPPA